MFLKLKTVHGSSLYLNANSINSVSKSEDGHYYISVGNRGTEITKASYLKVIAYIKFHGSIE